MGGYFVDVFIVYLFKTIARALKKRRSEGWPVAKGTVLTAGFQSPGFGCDTSEVVYTIVVNGKKYTGMHEKPFLMIESAKDYASHFLAGQEIVVRYNPVDPTASFVRD